MRKRKSGILKVGVTGGIGSGKTTVCRIFENLGVHVIYADALAKEISVTHENVRSKINELLGPSAYTTDGALDRQHVAARIFSDKQIQKKLNAIVHPEVVKAIEQEFAKLEKQGTPLAIVEAALIYETGFDKHLHYIIVVEAGEEQRLERLAGWDAVKREEVRKRMEAQWNPSEKRVRADFVIVNQGTLEQLEEKVRLLYAVLQNL